MPDFDQFGIPKKTAQPSAKVDAYGIPIKGPVQPPVDIEQIRKVPSFKEFAASKGLPIYTQRQMAEGTYGPDLAMKAKMDRDVEEAPDRKRTRAIQEGQRKNEALINTTRKRLNGKGVKYEDFDPIFKKELESTKADVESGVLVLSEDASRNPVYKQGLGFIESLGYAFKQSVDESITAAKFDRADSRERQKIAEEELKKEQEFIPTGIGGKIGEILGSAAPLIAEARIGATIGTEIAPGYGTMAGIAGSVLATLPDAFSKGRKAEMIKRYNQEIDEIKRLRGTVTQEEKDAAMQRASSVGIVGGLAEAGVVSALSFVGGSPAAAKGLLNAVKNWGKHATYDVTRQVAVGVASEAAKGITAKAVGYNVTAGDIIEDAVRRGGSDAEMALAFSAYHATQGVPKYVKSAAKNYLNSMPRPDLNNLSQALEGQGAIPKGATAKMNTELDAFEQAKQEFKGLVPEEDMGTFAGLALRKKNLEEKIKSTTLAPVRAKLQEESDAIDVRMEAMLRSKNPVIDEVNDLTGDTGEAEILTEDRVQEAVDNVSKQPFVEPTRYDLRPTVKIEGREYYGTDHGEAMRRAIESGEDIPSPDTPEGEIWREENGLFRERDTNKLLTRNDAETRYGIRRSQELSPIGVETVVVPKEAIGPQEEIKYTREQAKQILSEIDVPANPEGLAMWALASGRKVNYGSFKSETGGKSEAYGSGFTAAVKEKAPSVERLAEQLWEEYIPEDKKLDITSMDIRDSLIDLMSSYKNKTEITQDFIKMYSPEVAERAMEARMPTQDELVVLDDAIYYKSQYDNFLKQVGEVEESARISDEYVDQLIKEYEQGIIREGAEAPTAAEGRPTEQVVTPRVAEKAREAVGEIARRLGDDAEVSEFEAFSKAERARPDFDAEYRRERVDGETVEQYLLKKYCR